MSPSSPTSTSSTYASASSAMTAAANLFVRFLAETNSSSSSSSSTHYYDSHDDHDHDYYGHDDHGDEFSNNATASPYHNSTALQDDYDTTVASIAASSGSGKPWGDVIAASFAIIAVTFAGAFLAAMTQCVPRFRSNPTLYRIIVPAFAAGALMATSAFLILPESLSLLAQAAAMQMAQAAAVSKQEEGIHEDHEDHGDGHEEEGHHIEDHYNETLEEHVAHSSEGVEHEGELHADEAMYVWKFGAALLGGFLFPILLHALFPPKPQTPCEECEYEEQGRLTTENGGGAGAAPPLIKKLPGDGIDVESPHTDPSSKHTATAHAEDTVTLNLECEAGECPHEHHATTTTASAEDRLEAHQERHDHHHHHHDGECHHDHPNHENQELADVCAGDPGHRHHRHIVTPSGDEVIDCDDYYDRYIARIKTGAGGGGAVSPHHHPTGGECGDKEVTKVLNMPLAFSILIGDAFHNFTDGVFLGTSFLLCSKELAYTLMATTIYHEIAQELADFVLLTHHCGLPIWKALLANFISGWSTLVGAVVIFSADLSPEATGCILALACGFYIYITAVESVPTILDEIETSQTMSQGKGIFIFFLCFVLGAVPIGLVLLNHGHCEAGGEEHNH